MCWKKDKLTISRVIYEVSWSIRTSNDAHVRAMNFLSVEKFLVAACSYSEIFSFLV
uniref:Uncharacterized protein n=1 Tax=Rhizophora mucronata TaxID=61149 RepID=A0A2P2ML35_RHIMU